MATRVKKCKNCGERIQEILVYKNSHLRRTRVAQCPNHCDLKCPQCDSHLATRVSRNNSSEKTLRCKNCEWRGFSPCRELFKEKAEAEEAVQRARDEAQMEKIKRLREKEEQRARKYCIKANQVHWKNGEPFCPHCDVHTSRVESVVFTDIRGVQRMEVSNVCQVTGCGRSWFSHREVKRTVSKFGNRSAGFYSSITFGPTCNSCGQSIRGGSVCGCS